MFRTIPEYFDGSRRAPCARGHASNLQCTTALVERYVGWFTGACFDPRMDEPWWQPNRFTSTDLLGVAALSMGHVLTNKRMKAFGEVFDQDAAAASVACATDCTEHQACILRQIPATADIWDPSAPIYIDLSNKLWKMLHKSRPKGVGDIAINKLVSHKRPYLLPVVDRVSKDRMKLNNGGRVPSKQWRFLQSEIAPLQTLLSGPLHSIRVNAGVPLWVSDIRLIDIAIWMDHEHPC